MAGKVKSVLRKLAEGFAARTPAGMALNASTEKMKGALDAKTPGERGSVVKSKPRKRAKRSVLKKRGQ